MEIMNYFIIVLFMQQQSKLLSLPKRIKGKHLNTFKENTIQTNYYSVKVYESIEQIYIYKIVFQPFIPADNIKQRIALLQKGMNDIKSFIPSPVISGSNIYSLKPPSQNQRTIKIDDYSVTIKHVKLIPVRSNPKTLLMFLNNGLRNMFKKVGYTEIGKTGKFFKIDNAKSLDSSLKMFNGYKANFMWLEKGIYLRVDPAKKIVRTETVLDFINELYSKNKNKERDEKRNILKQELIGQIIMTNYGKARYVKIVDLVFQSIDDIKLNGTETTLRKFYEQKYQKKIENPKQPLIEIQSRSKKQGDRCLLIPELCLMTGIPDSFDEYKRKKISEATIKSPNEKREQIQNFIRESEKVNDLSSLKELGIQIDKRLCTIKAKLIPCPKLQLGNGRAVQNGKQANFQIFKDPLFQSKHSVKCGLFVHQKVQINELVDTFKSTSKNLGVRFEMQIFQNRQNDKNRILKAYFQQIQSSIRKYGINIALIVIPNFMKQNYSQIKQQCLKKLNIVSQCVVQSTLGKKGLRSIATKILLQMIAKRGNTLWVPKITGKINDSMIMAFDNAKGHGGNSIVCCSSTNDNFSEYYSKTSNYSNDQNKFNEMVKLSFQSVNYYTKKNSRPPKQIIIFHNSCTGDQVNLFRNFFLETLQTKLKETRSVPNISLVMVNTKTSQRFFTPDQNTRNVAAGTLVADDIVSENYDFYLVSQGSNRGSTVPNHYKVVFTNSQIEEGLLHELIFSQCFNYVNWTGSIKIPGILQYAKKCAKFSADALDGSRVQEDLDSKLYFV